MATIIYMNEESNFIDGLRVSSPKENAPDFVKANLSIKSLDMIKYLLKNTEGVNIRTTEVLQCVKYLETVIPNEWINGQILKSKKGMLYVKRDTWKPDPNFKGGNDANDMDAMLDRQFNQIERGTIQGDERRSLEQLEKASMQSQEEEDLSTMPF